MAIADRIEEMYTHVGDVYDTITNVELPEDKNIENIPRTIKDSYLEIMNNGTQQVWDNWSKTTGTGETLTLNNTEEAPMTIALKGNTSQNITTGKNLFNKYGRLNDGGGRPNTVSLNSQGQIVTTANYNEWRGRGQLIENLLSNTDYTISGTLISATGTANNNAVIQILTTTNSIISDLGISKTETKPYQFSLTFNTGENTSILISFSGNDADTTVRPTTIFDNIQVEKGTATSYEPYTNGASPNPDYPQPIQVVSGDNSIVVCGKNLLSPNFSDYTLSTGNYGYIQVSKEPESLILSITDKDTSVDITGCYLGFTYTGYNSSTGLNWILNGGSSPVATSVGNTSRQLQYISFYPKNEATFNKIFSRYNVQVEKGSSASTYEPYTRESYPVNLGTMELCKIGTYQDKIDKSSGKNLFDKDNVNIFNGYWSNNTLIAQSNSYGVYISCQPNTTYTISKHVGTTFRVATTTNTPANNVSTLSSTANHTGTNITITTEANAKYIWVNYYGSTDTYGQQNMLDSIMINEGTTALEYEPYGTGWYVKKEIGKVVLDGSESWGYNSTNKVFWGSLETLGFDYTVSDKGYVQKLSNYFIYNASSGNSPSLPDGMYENSNVSSQTQLLIHYANITTLADFKTWLGTHNLIVYYVLKTPTYTLIEDSTLISQLETIKKSYEGQTNITQENNDMPFELDVVALEGDQ